MKVSTDPIALTLGASPVIVVAYHSVIDWATTTGFDGVSAVVGPFIFGVGLLSLRVVRNQGARRRSYVYSHWRWRGLPPQNRDQKLLR
jgi:hypothetical protein